MINTRQKRMSAMNPACPWRGPMVNALETGFFADKRAAADYMYSGVEAGPPTPGGGFLEPTYFIVNCGRMMSRRGS